MTLRILACLFVAACFEATAPPPTDNTLHVVMPVLAERRELDVLVVIDDSPTMAAHRDHLRATYGSWIAQLAAIRGGLPDLHLGVVTTDLGAQGADGVIRAPHGACHGDGDGGRLLTTGAVSGPFITDALQADGTHARNYTGSLVDAFAALADVGSAGCEFSQPLEAMRRALEGNPGFLRAEAGLVVVFVTAQDDCSYAHGGFLDSAADPFDCVAHATDLAPTAAYAQFLAGLKHDPSDILVVTGTGPAEPFVIDAAQRRVEPSCSTSGTSAVPAPRLDSVRTQLSTDWRSLCTDDLGQLLELGGGPVILPLEASCIGPRLRDRDPATPGVQARCTVVLETNLAHSQRLDECGGPTSSTPCWTIVADSATCYLESGERFAIAPSEGAYPLDTTAVIDCALP